VRFTATRADAESVIRVACNMRAADLEECLATRWSDDPMSIAEDTLVYPGLTWVGRLYGEPVAVYGAKPMWPGVWSAFLYATDKFDKIGIHLTEHIRSVMIPWLIAGGARRVEARSIATHDKAHRWMRFLGAREESRMPLYGKRGEEFVMFVWTADSVRNFRRQRR
jgi:hypothetical protein